MGKRVSATDVVVFMEQPIEFEWLRGNLFRVFNPSSGVTLIAEADVLAETVTNAAACYGEYRRSRGGQVIPFPKQEVAAKH